MAQALCANKLIFLSDVPGVLRDRDDPTSLIHTLDEVRACELIASGVIDAGMIPKIEACLETIRRGVGKVHIVDGRVRHSLLLEIYTSSGIGTQIIREIPTFGATGQVASSSHDQPPPNQTGTE